jgi:hypothetical protein
MHTFLHQLKLLGATGRCRVANMVVEPEVSQVQILADAIYQNKLQSTHIPCLRPTGAAHEREC